MFKEVEQRECGDLTYKIVHGAGASVVSVQDSNEYQRDVLILNHVEAVARRDWLTLALGAMPAEGKDNA